jgi:2-hydroxy fatty acid dioxygenase
MEPVVGGIMAPLIIGGTAYSHYLTSTYGKPVNVAAGVVQAISWILQFVGHGAFEGRAPALLDNLVQALFLAPFFVFFELMFMLGYRPELKARLDKAVEEELKKLESKGKEKKASSNGSANGSAKDL